MGAVRLSGRVVELERNTHRSAYDTECVFCGHTKAQLTRDGLFQLTEVPECGKSFTGTHYLVTGGFMAPGPWGSK